MTRVGAAVIVVLLTCPTVAADIYIEEVNGTDSYSFGWRTDETRHPSSELWIGETRAAYHTPGRIFLVDLERETFIHINKNSETYVETSLPLELSRFLSDRLMTRYEVWRRSGTVQQTDRTEEILSRTALEYEVELWEVESGVKSNEQSLRVWATTDVGFDWKRIDVLLVPLRTLLNRDAELRRELLEIRGVQLKTEWWSGWLGSRQRHFTEVTEIAADREPPPGVYSVPEGFVRKERLTREDF